MASPLRRSLASRPPGPLLGAAAAASLSLGPSALAFAQSPQSPLHPNAPSPYTPSTSPTLEAGGLRPPASAPPSAGESATLQGLRRAEREDAGRGLEFVWVDLEGGYEHAALQAFNAGGLFDGDVVSDTGSGLALGVGAGVRLIFLTLGGRFRLLRSDDWDLWTLDAELGLHLPVGALEPWFTFAAGYAALGAPSAKGASGFDPDAVDVAGVNARLGANLDYYVNPLLSFGARATFEGLALWRSGADQPAAAPAATAEAYEDDGNGLGFGVTLGAAVGLHF